MHATSRSVALSLATVLGILPASASSAQDEVRIIEQPISITVPGIPITCRSQNAHPGQEIGLRASAFNERAGTTDVDATGIDACALACNVLGASHAVGVGIEAVGSGFSPAGLSESYGVRGTAFDGEANKHVGVQGTALDDGGTGVVGTALGRTLALGVLSLGDFAATGSKSFVQPHPRDAARVIAFVSLEGNESGTYFRGRARLVDGVAEIEIPEEWRLVTDADGITVQVTPIGSPTLVWVVEQTRERIVLRGDSDSEVNYFVNGVRRGFADHEPFRENRFFRPEVAGVPFGRQYPEELRRILVENGTLRSDYTPNEATALRLGWHLRDPEQVPHERRWWVDAAERRRVLEERAAGRE